MSPGVTGVTVILSGKGRSGWRGSRLGAIVPCKDKSLWVTAEGRQEGCMSPPWAHVQLHSMAPQQAVPLGMDGEGWRGRWCQASASGGPGEPQGR